jgi:hypothetical protein
MQIGRAVQGVAAFSARTCRRVPNHVTGANTTSANRRQRQQRAQVHVVKAM